MRAPGVSSIDDATLSIADAGSPASSETRWSSDSLKFSSPRMAASVISRTFGSTPACAPSISMTSPWISVESTSNTTSRFARRVMPARSTATSIPASYAASASTERSSASASGVSSLTETYSSSPVTG